jgi:hypothetical protein
MYQKMQLLVYVILVVLICVLLPLGIVLLVNSKYTKRVKAKYLAGNCTPTVCKCTQATYVVNGTTYTWTAFDANDAVVVHPDNRIVGQSEIDLYYDPKNPSSARSKLDSGYTWGIILIAIGVLVALFAAVNLIYEKFIQIQHEAAVAAKSAADAAKAAREMRRAARSR